MQSTHPAQFAQGVDYSYTDAIGDQRKSGGSTKHDCGLAQTAIDWGLDMGAGGSKGIKVDPKMYLRLESLVREGETKKDFVLRCGIKGTTNMSKWKGGQAISAQSLMLIVNAHDKKTSMDWLVFGHSLATDHSAELVERIASEINIVLERAYSLTDGPSAGEPLLRQPSRSHVPVDVIKAGDLIEPKINQRPVLELDDNKPGE